MTGTASKSALIGLGTWKISETLSRKDGAFGTSFCAMVKECMDVQWMFGRPRGIIEAVSKSQPSAVHDPCQVNMNGD